MPKDVSRHECPGLVVSRGWKLGAGGEWRNSTGSEGTGHELLPVEDDPESAGGTFQQKPVSDVGHVRTGRHRGEPERGATPGAFRGAPFCELLPEGLLLPRVGTLLHPYRSLPFHRPLAHGCARPGPATSGVEVRRGPPVMAPG